MNQSNRNALRTAVLDYLAGRQAFEFDCPAILRHMVNRALVDFDVSEADVQQTLVFLEGLGLVAYGRRYAQGWAATSAGVVAAERRDLRYGPDAPRSAEEKPVLGRLQDEVLSLRKRVEMLESIIKCLPDQTKNGKGAAV